MQRRSRMQWIRAAEKLLLPQDPRAPQIKKEGTWHHIGVVDRIATVISYFDMIFGPIQKRRTGTAEPYYYNI